MSFWAEKEFRVLFKISFQVVCVCECVACLATKCGGDQFLSVGNNSLRMKLYSETRKGKIRLEDTRMAV